MRRPGRSNGLLVGVVSAILQPVDVWPSGLLPGQAPVRSEVGIAPTSVLSGGRRRGDEVEWCRYREGEQQRATCEGGR
jgi:hypothetical protein